MKKINLIAAVLILGIVIQGCKKLDDERLNPVNSVPAGNAINNLASAQAAVNGIYSDLQDGDLVYDGYMAFPVIYTDEGTFTGTFTSRVEVENLTITTSNTTLAALFSDFYDVINTANNVIKRVPEVEDVTLTDAMKNEFVAHGRFIRALCYLHLTSYFKEVPLIVNPTESVQPEAINLPKATQQQIFAQIISDLNYAETNLPVSGTIGTGNTKATSEAATALLARAYLYNKDWANALTTAKIIADANNVTDHAYLEDGIFYLGFTASDGNSLPFWLGPEELNGRHDIEPSAKLMAAYEKDVLGVTIIDERYDLSITNDPNVAATPFIKKYPSFSAAGGTATDPVMFIRLSEVALIAAEAAAEQGDFPAASGYINQVRQRAGLADITLDANNFVDAILQERFVELAFEGPHRWLDLRRKGRAIQEITGYQACNDVWPIPQREIDRNTKLIQDPCY